MIRAMLGTLCRYWTEAEAYQKFLYTLGAIALTSAGFHVGVLALAGGSLQGDVSWRKPIVFGESFGLTLWSIGWIMTFLPKELSKGWLVSATLGVASSAEVFLVSMLKVPHALSLHAAQVLPALAWLALFTKLSERQRTVMVLVGTIGYAGLVGVSGFQTFSGLAVVDVSLPVAVALALGVGLLFGSFGWAIFGLWQTATRTAELDAAP